MSITTLSLYESVLQQEYPTAWWGLDTADPTVDDSGHGYTLTAVGGGPANNASLIARGDTGASGARDFNGTTQGYTVNGTITGPATVRPTYTGFYAAFGNATTSVTLLPPSGSSGDDPTLFTDAGGIAAGDLMIAILNNTTDTATISAAPGGWTALLAASDYGPGAMAIYVRTADSSDELHPSYTWTWSAAGANNLSSAIVSFRGCDPTQTNLIFDSGYQSTATGIDHSTTTETSPSGASSQIAIFCGDYSGTQIVPGPGTGGASRRLVTVDSGTTGKLVVQEYEKVAGDAGSRFASSAGVSTNLGAVMITFGGPAVVTQDGLDTVASKLSLHAVINPDTIVGNDTIIRKLQAWGMLLVAGVLTYVYRDGGGVDRTISGPTLAAGVTRHVDIADDDANVYFYLDGQLVQTTARTGTAGFTQNTNPITLGHFNNAGATDFFDGKIDEVAVFGGARLMPSQVRTFANAGLLGTFGTKLLQGKAPYPGLMLEIAWDSKPTDSCRSFEDVTSYVRDSGGITTSRMRNFELDRIQTGRMTFRLSDRERNFDSQNASSPFYPNIKPTRAVRLRAQAQTDGVVQPIFFGFTEGWPLRRSEGGLDEVAEFTAQDIFMGLNLNVIQTEDSRSAELSGTRLTHLFSAIDGIPYSGDPGQSVVASADLQGVNRLDHGQAVAVDSDGGILFGDRKGTAIFQDRTYRTKNERTVRAIYGSAELPFTLLEPKIDEARLFTAAKITPSSGTAQYAVNTAQALDHFPRTKEISNLQASDIDAAAMANAYANRYSTPRQIIPQIQLAPIIGGSAMFATVLSHELSHRIKTIDRPFGATVSREHYIEGISHTISAADWRVTLAVSPAELDGDFLLIGTGKIGDNGGATSAIIGW